MQCQNNIPKWEAGQYQTENGKPYVNIMDISEVRWKGAGIVDTNGYKFVRSRLASPNGVDFIIDKERLKAILGN